MATKVGEFFIDLAVDAATGNLSVKQLVSALGELEVASVTSVGILAKIGDSLWNLAKAATGTAVEMSDLRDITGIDTTLAQQWEKAAQRINVHAGSIVASIHGVNNMMGAIAARKAAPPMELTGWLGINPHTGRMDAKGHPVMKNFFDLMGELGNSKSKYWGYAPQVQQQLLGGAFPGSDPKDLFRILNEMRAGRFRPQDISVLDKSQVKDLNHLREQETEASQKITGIFEKLLVGGEGFAKILGAINEKLTALDKWLGSKEAHADLKLLGNAGAGIIRRNGNPFTIGLDYGQHLGERFFPHPAPAPRLTPSMTMDMFHGKLDLTILGARGERIGSKEVFLRQGVTNSTVDQTTVNVGNGGLGQ